MSHGFAGTVADFSNTDDDALIGALVDAVAATGVDQHRTAQVQAWRDQIRILRRELAGEPFRDWFLVLEYEIPRRLRRPDVILIHGSAIFVVEFKVGATRYDAAARWQVRSYAMDLRDFHTESSGRVIVPVLCATRAPQRVAEDLPGIAREAVTEVVLATESDLGQRILALHQRLNRTDDPIDPARWLASPYRPSPRIVEAAVRLYRGHGVRDISHHHACNLDRTTERLVEAVREARRAHQRMVCFVTGIPGSGKTLTGLEVVHDRQLTRESAAAGVFLSGNGPLVKVVREALVMDQIEAGRRRKDCEHEVRTFIQNIHQFLRYHREHPDARPHEHVVVFDEAQRAWNSAQMARKQGVARSEADELLDVMERVPDWAVVVALVGGGQEIYLGEAGLEAWGRALAERADRWCVLASPAAVHGDASVAGHRLFETPPPALRLREERSLHLSVGVRSRRAQNWAEWANAFLAQRWDDARGLAPHVDEFPCLVTRDLDGARSWLREMRAIEPSHRIGLLASSEDPRVRAHGLEVSSAFRRGYPYDKWFLAPPSDVRASISLEVAATEFECQGLELDWVCVCWGGDLTPAPEGAGWTCRKFRGDRWQSVRRESEKDYVLNRYRVLLTRARLGLVVWVPPGAADDPTRAPGPFQRIHEALVSAGLRPLEGVTSQ